MKIFEENATAYSETAQAVEETAIVAADEIGFKDTSASMWKRISWTNTLASIKTYTDTLYSLTGHEHVESDITVSAPCLLGRATAGTGVTEELTASQGRTYLNIADNADATGYRGSMGTTARNALTGLVSGQWIWNSDLGHRQERYDGTFWLGPRDIVLTNRTGANSVYGKSWIVSPNYDFAIANPGTDNNIRVAGVVALGGVADGSPVVVTTNAVVVDALMEADDDSVRGYFVSSWSNGENYTTPTAVKGNYGIALESANDINNNYTIKILSGLPTETF